MTKARTDFVADDRAIARRALWLLDGNPPGRGQPPPDLDLGRLWTFVGANGVLEPLAHFAERRRDDAELAAGPARAKPGDERHGHAELQPVWPYVAQAEASRLEKRASDLLREARANVRTAVRHWRRAAELRAGDENKVGVLDLGSVEAMVGSDGKHQAILADLSSLEATIDEAVARLEPSLRRMMAGDRTPAPSGSRLRSVSWL